MAMLLSDMLAGMTPQEAFAWGAICGGFIVLFFHN